MGADEHVFAELDAIEQGNPILNTRTSANHGTCPNEHTLAQHRALADASARHHVHEMPNLGVSADLGASLHDGCRMNERGAGPCHL
jgi:hypothetical protein